MTKSKHTPGPWKAVVNSSDYWEVVHPWREQSFDEANAYSPTVVHVCTKEGAEQEANARLIAESPTMHDLLLNLQAVRSPRELHNLRCEVAEVLARIEGV